MMTAATFRTRPMATATRAASTDNAAIFAATIAKHEKAGLSHAQAIRAAVRECTESAHREWLAAQQPRPA